MLADDAPVSHRRPLTPPPRPPKSMKRPRTAPITGTKDLVQDGSPTPGRWYKRVTPTFRPTSSRSERVAVSMEPETSAQGSDEDAGEEIDFWGALRTITPPTTTPKLVVPRPELVLVGTPPVDRDRPLPPIPAGEKPNAITPLSADADASSFAGLTPISRVSSFHLANYDIFCDECASDPTEDAAACELKDQNKDQKRIIGRKEPPPPLRSSKPNLRSKRVPAPPLPSPEESLRARLSYIEEAKNVQKRQTPPPKPLRVTEAFPTLASLNVLSIEDNGIMPPPPSPVPTRLSSIDVQRVDVTNSWSPTLETSYVTPISPHFSQESMLRPRVRKTSSASLHDLFKEPINPLPRKGILLNKASSSSPHRPRLSRPSTAPQPTRDHFSSRPSTAPGPIPSPLGFTEIKKKFHMNWDRTRHPWNSEDFDEDVFHGYSSADDRQFRRSRAISSPGKRPDSKVIRPKTSGSMTDSETPTRRRLRKKSLRPSTAPGRPLPESGSEKTLVASSIASSTRTKTFTLADQAPEFKGDVNPTMRELFEASLIPVWDQHGQWVQFGKLFEDQVTIVVFIRHFMCPNCMDYMRSVAKDVNSGVLDAYRVKLIAIGCGDPAQIKAYKKMVHSPFELYTDPKRQLHTALGMTLKTLDGGPEGSRGSYVRHGTFIGTLNVIGKAVKHMPPSALVKKPGDMKQLGGEFVLGPGLRCHFAHRMTTTRNHADILRVCAKAGVDMTSPIPPHLRPFHLTPDQEEEWMERRYEGLQAMRRKKIIRRTTGELSNLAVKLQDSQLDSHGEDVGVPAPTVQVPTIVVDHDYDDDMVY